MAMSRLDFEGVVGEILLGLLAGPLVFYTIAGDYWNSFILLHQFAYARLITGLIAFALVLAGMMVAMRYRNAGVAGGIFGFAGAIGQLIIALLPWLGLHAIAKTCGQGPTCTGLDSHSLTQLGMTVGIFSAILYTAAGYFLALFMASVRRSMAK